MEALQIPFGSSKPKSVWAKTDSQEWPLLAAAVRTQAAVPRPIRTHHFWDQAREGRLGAFSYLHHVSITPRHQRHDCRSCEVFQGGRNVFRVMPLDHFD